jgi:hypothetical protein
MLLITLSIVIGSISLVLLVVGTLLGRRSKRRRG